MLSQRLERVALAKFDGNKRKAIEYLDQQSLRYARRADRYYGTPYYQAWKAVYRAYSNARWALGYYLSLDQELARAFDDYFDDEPRHYFTA